VRRMPTGTALMLEGKSDEDTSSALVRNNAWAHYDWVALRRLNKSCERWHEHHGRSQRGHVCKFCLSSLGFPQRITRHKTMNDSPTTRMQMRRRRARGYLERG